MSRNGHITERHLPAWEQALASAKEHLSQRCLPVLQRTIIEQQMAGKSSNSQSGHLAKNPT